LGLEEFGDVADSGAIAIVFDDGEDRAGANAEGDFLNVIAEVFAMDFDPGIEEGILRDGNADDGGRLEQGLPGTQCSGDCETRFEEGAARVLHQVDFRRNKNTNETEWYARELERWARALRRDRQGPVQYGGFR